VLPRSPLRNRRPPPPKLRRHSSPGLPLAKGEVKLRDGRLQPALKKDHRERHATDQIGSREIAKRDAKHPVLTGQHAEGQKGEQHWRTESSRYQADDHAQHTEQPGTAFAPLSPLTEILVELPRKAAQY
jgi:hypothetical protein